jgi:proteasome assembly chaperone (PAC2) family protein
MEEIQYLEKPNLNKPILVIGFEGWPNAAEVSSAALQYLVEELGARKFAFIPLEDFHDLAVSRPAATIKEGRLIELKFPGNYFYYSKDVHSKDFIFFQGVEPHLRWSLFVNLLLDLAEEFDVSQVFTLGGTYDYIPHTCPPVVSALVSHEDLREKVIQAGLGLTEYTGPISIHTFILESARKRGLKAMSLWGHAPQYLQTRNIRVVHSVVRSLFSITGVRMDLSELEKASDLFNQQVDRLVEQDPKLQQVISKLEEIYKQSGQVPAGEKKEDGTKEDKIVYIQAFLKKQDDEGKKEDY